MSISALILMSSVCIAITALTVYFVVKLIKKK
jgi:hypothetical protein